MITLTAIIYPDEQTDWLVAKCSESGAASQAKTEAEALVNLKEATELYLGAFPDTRPKAAKVTSFELSHAETPRRGRQ